MDQLILSGTAKARRNAQKNSAKKNSATEHFTLTGREHACQRRQALTRRDQFQPRSRGFRAVARPALQRGAGAPPASRQPASSRLARKYQGLKPHLFPKEARLEAGSTRPVRVALAPC